ncbi:heavy metal-associated domain-containing protein [uncultured Polaribacter sp.]|uniref:cation transporter n=1 Tax=uncultured Polaribacter sp. TaxID=174711 RepID=UPI00260CE11F|nr:heavy metal-associated domain-containing protein [uncultured Polaribacter sp.]
MMTTKNIFFAIAIALFTLTSCKETKDVKKEKIALAISGMTCEIGCAKTIQSKLSKKEGVIDAKVVFTDSIANIEYDANTTSKKDLIAFVGGIAGGDLYKASETTAKINISKKMAHTCADNCSENCEMKMADKAKCCVKDADGKMSCLADCKMACCADKTTK